MTKFNKQYVHFMWDDELEGKEVLGADSIDLLESRVVNYNGSIGVVIKSSNSGYPFSVNGTNYRFVYYDPYFQVKLAHEQGKKIECKRKGNAWEYWNYTPYPKWLDEYEYRIKPEQSKPVTSRELAKWLAQGNGEVYCYDSEDGYVSNVHTYLDYDISSGEEKCNQNTLPVKVRKWEDSEWHEPTREYMGLEG